MPTISTAASADATVLADGITTLNVIRADASAQYQSRIPEAIDSNISAIGNVILTIESVRNEFLSGLLNKVGLTNVTARSYNNPLAPFKRGELLVGESVEEIFINLIPENAYDVELAEDRVWKRVIPDVRSAFHRINRQGYFKWTIQMQDLRQAFYSVQNFETFVERLMERMNTSDQLHEFLYMKDIFRRSAERGHLAVINSVNPVDEATGKQFMTTLRKLSTDMTFMRDDLSATVVPTHTPRNEQYMFVLSGVEAVTSVNVLASAFNLGNVNYTGNVIVLDDFGGLENEGVIAIVVDRNWFNVYDTFLANTSLENPEGPYRNYYLHHHQILSYSPYVNAVAIVDGTSGTITSLTIDPATATISKSRTTETRFTVTFEGTGVIYQGLRWTVETDVTTSEVRITSEGKLIVPRNDPATTVTVTATSIYDENFTAIAQVTLTA